MKQLALRLAVFGSAVGALGAGAADVVNVGKASGYSITFVEATPKPGSKLTQGEHVSFTVASVDTPNPATSGHLKTGHHGSGRDVFILGLTGC